MSERADYDVVVIGGGHAGAEAAWSAANVLRPAGGRVALVTMDAAKIGAMSCNPAIGGLAKGQMVGEVDALGGLMGLAADATGIQFKVLNASKGPAVRGPRCQSDKYRYAAEVRRLLATRANLDVIAGSVERLLVEGGRCVGIEGRGADRGENASASPFALRCSAVVLTTGTFMRGLMHTGDRQTPGGRVGESPAVGISGALRSLGFELGRLKTGTPPRLARGSLDLNGLEVARGDAVPTPFSAMTGGVGPGVCSPRADAFPRLPQVDCWITHTNAAVHDTIRANLDRAPMYNGQIAPGTTGPRYCPSIEDKVVRFADRQAHHVFLEPESLDTDEVYCNGISTSLPADVQDAIVHALPGCERATILRHGYAVEYDMVLPHQIDATAMTKRVPGLFLAGQINGTSGYEEAAGQGLIAGLNAARRALGDEPVRLRRDQAYIGVLMDDLVTKTPREPYRMFTSRAEHRLLLRADNAEDRLTPLGRDLGLVDDDRWAVWERKRDACAAAADWLSRSTVDDRPAARWAAAPGRTSDELAAVLPDAIRPRDPQTVRGLATLLADLQYAGYVKRHEREMARLAEHEDRPLPADLAYGSITGLRTEAAQVLDRFRPATIGQAGRLEGVNPPDLMVLSVALRRGRRA